jgi:tripartite-type tricarboxylate transporter receptor subunit TctC
MERYYMNFFSRKLIFATIGSFSSFCITLSAVQAQTYPNKPIHIIVPYAAGGVADNSSRLFAKALEQELQQSIVIENRPGGGGRIGAEAVVRMPADGYSLLLTTNGTQTYMPVMEDSLSYNPIKDFTPLSLIASYGFLMVVNPSLPVKNVTEFINYAKKNPGKLNFASSGPGSGPHFAGEVFKSMAGIDMTHIAYKGTGPGLIAVSAKEVDLIFAADANALIDSGMVRLLGTTSGTRDPRYPNSPTIAEAGLKGYDLISWIGFYGPRDLPEDVQRTLNTAVQKAIRNPNLRKSLTQMGLVPVGSTPQELVKMMLNETDKLRTIAASIPGGIKKE